MKFIFDIDKTVYFHDNPILTDAIIGKLQAIQNEGHELVVATRRQVSNLDPVKKLIANKNTTLICMNGGYIEHDGEVISTPLVDINKIFAFLNIHNINFLAMSESGFFKSTTDVISEGFEDFINSGDTEQLTSLNHQFYSVMCKTPRDYELEDFLEDLNVQYDYDEMYENYFIFPFGISKFMAIKQLGITEYCAFGDDIADYQMVDNATHGFIIGEQFPADYHGKAILLSAYDFPKKLDELTKM